MSLRLRIVQGRPHGQQLCFSRGEYLFGRGAECHVRPNSEWVSRQHCLLRVTADAAWIRDLGSRNGTLINGARLVSEHSLRPGDRVEVGPLVFEVQFEGDSISDTLTCELAEAETLPVRGPDPAGPLREPPTPPGGVRWDPT